MTVQQISVKDGASEPQAQQVTDRFHLLMNLRQLAQRVTASAYSRLKKLPVPPDIRPKSPPVLRTQYEQICVNAMRQQRLDFYNEVQCLKAKGVSGTNKGLHCFATTTPFVPITTQKPSRNACRDAPE